MRASRPGQTCNIIAVSAAERDPRHAPIVEQLRSFAKNFQVDEIANILRNLES